ncbi:MULTISPECIES: YtpI family protein [Bacillaceae]|uniref:YtpI family protein n=1 Tax=Evansella alkalicola TaxID=745819 RepID=A0ABS6JSB8_9BACI|nr:MULTISPECIES: YtpI family protein [Bacillaceae]MBU9721132.1 YtpI family protein [Bacillus alkalicola]
MIFVILIIFSLIFFVYYKVQQARVGGPMERRWYAAKGSIAIGIFFISFGINSYLSLGSQVAAYVALLFVAFGLVNIIFGGKNYKNSLPYARKEIELRESEANNS